ncbi:T9SS type A sorting domain-containing protein, partial [candidate division KSB1 bacterium]|nr:T9SS type A sorting domain-containing protein [candidate division KSB1 bacterium]
SSGGDTLVFEGPHYWETMYPPDVMYSVKTDTGWSYPKLFFENYDGNRSWESYPFISANGKSIWFRASYHRDWGRDLIYSKWDGEKWIMPVRLGLPVNTEQAEMAPALSSDDCELFFVRIYDKGDSIRGEEIYVSKRLSNIVYEIKNEKQLGCFKAYPNPFNSKVVLEGQDINGVLKLVIYNIIGKEVFSFQGLELKSQKKWVWNGTDFSGAPVSGGVYFCRVFFIGGRSEVLKILYLK